MTDTDAQPQSAADAIAEVVEQKLADEPTVDPAAENATLERLDFERKIAELSEKYSGAEQEIARREQTINRLQLTQARSEAARDLGVKPDLIKGGSTEEIEAHAKELRAWKEEIEAKNRPRGPLFSGSNRMERPVQPARLRAAQMLRDGGGMPPARW